jgi:hypothetical protein
MPRYQVWVSQLRTLDVVVQAETARDAEAQVRAQLGESPHTQAWLDSATVMVSERRCRAERCAPISLRSRLPSNCSIQPMLASTSASAAPRSTS